MGKPVKVRNGPATVNKLSGDNLKSDTHLFEITIRPTMNREVSDWNIEEYSILLQHPY